MRKTKAPELVQFGSNVRKLRESKDWTQEQLAEKATLDQTYISGIERGERNATILTITKLAAALRTTASTLCERIDR
jgi:transcriptional regulator with XRE-family HTH domain